MVKRGGGKDSMAAPSSLSLLPRPPRVPSSRAFLHWFFLLHLFQVHFILFIPTANVLIQSPSVGLWVTTVVSGWSSVSSVTPASPFFPSWSHVLSRRQIWSSPSLSCQLPIFLRIKSHSDCWHLKSSQLAFFFFLSLCILWKSFPSTPKLD